MAVVKAKGIENVCSPDAVKYRNSKKLGCWIRTWFTIETDDAGMYFKQHMAYSSDRNKDWEKWSNKPVSKVG